MSTMQSLISSLRSLPPKQALLLALAEKQKRVARKIQQQQALERAREYAESSSRTEDLPPSIDPNIPSLVLDRNHPLSDLYYKHARNKVYWGGRGSAKSWGFAEALVRKAMTQPLRILCCREIQRTIADSSHKLLIDTIKRLGVEGWFEWTKTSITSRTGAEFIFRGLFQNEQGIRSVEGVDICWVEEAQTVTAMSWQSLSPTMRKPGSEIWVSYNLIDENDATHQRFVLNTRSNSIVHKINYDSNPFFAGSPLEQEMLDDKALDQHLYEHIWLGMALKVSDAIILSGKYVVQDFDEKLWTQAPARRLGLDFGFAQDPLALLSMFELNDCLYIERECYDTGIELDEMVDRMAADVPEVMEWPVKADSSRPETISHLRRYGVACHPAEKWDGCVKDGIAHLRKYRQIIIHSRCPNTAREARLYRYKTDPKIVDKHGQPLVLPVVIDKHNHTWDAARYGLDGSIKSSGSLNQWSRLAAASEGMPQ